MRQGFEVIIVGAGTGGLCLAQGLRTADIKSEGAKVVSTSQMGDAIMEELDRLAA